MKYLLIFFLAFAIGCTANNNNETNSDDTSTIGVDSTKIGADSGILRKLP